MKKSFIVALFLICGATALYLFISQQSAPVVVTPVKNNEPTSSAVPETKKTYIDAINGFSITYPSTLTVHPAFEGSYLLSDHWNINALNPDLGMPLVSFRIPESNEILMAEVRVGLSRTKSEVAACLLPPLSIPVKKQIISGVEFSVFTTADAAMSHFMNATSYRTVRDGTCIAIDHLVYGTNPEVYDPPKMVPFNRVIADEKLTALIMSFMFIPKAQ